MKDDTRPTASKRAKRNFDLTEKQKYYQQWKESGLNRNQFCKARDLCLSAFGKWCRKFESSKNSLPQHEWLPLISKNSNLETRKESMLVEFKITHSTKLYIFLFIFILISFLREIIHAITVIR